MGVHVAGKNEEDPIKSEGTGVVTTFLTLKVYGDFSRCSRASNSSPGRVLLNFKLIQAFMVFLVTS